MPSQVRLIVLIVFAFIATFESISMAQSADEELSAQEKEFAKAAKYADLEKLTTLVAQNADLAKSKVGTEAFVVAAAGTQDFHDEMVQILIKAGADVNTVASDGRTPMHAAVSSLHRFAEGRVRQFIELGACVNVSDNSGQTPLHLATDVAFEILIAAKADVAALDAEKHTTLYSAARRGETEGVKLLIEAGVNVNAKNKFGWSALHIASLRCNLESVKLLIEHGAEKNMKTAEAYARIPAGSTALEIARQLNRQNSLRLIDSHYEIIEFLGQ